MALAWSETQPHLPHAEESLPPTTLQPLVLAPTALWLWAWEKLGQGGAVWRQHSEPGSSTRS